MVLSKQNLLLVLFLWIEIFTTYKSVVAANGENVKGNLVRYMQSVIQVGTINADTIQAIEEVQQLKKDPNKKVYSSFNQILEELDDKYNIVQTTKKILN